MIIVPLETRRRMGRPFGVGRIAQAREDGTYLVHWYGNTYNQMQGCYRPAWRADRMGGAVETIYGPEGGAGDDRTKPYTSDEAGQSITAGNITTWGFRLTHTDRLPGAVLREIDQEPRISWTVSAPSR